MLKRIDAQREKLLNMPVCTALLFLPFFEPPGLGLLFTSFYTFFKAWKALSILIACAFFLARPKVSAITAAMGVYQVVLLVSTAVNHSSMVEWAYIAGETAGICLLVDQCVDTDVRAMVKGLFFSLGTLCVINLVSIIAFPGGMAGNEMYLFGLDNVHALFLVPMMAIAELYAYDKGWPYIVQLGAAVLLSAALYITWSVTGLLAVTAFLVLLVLYKVPKSWRLCNIYVYYAVVAAIFLVVIVFRAPERFSFIIENILHKDVTLSNRMPLWMHILELIKARPLLGYGKQTVEVLLEMIEMSHCHNIILQTLFDTGIAGMAVFLVQMGLIGRSLWRTRSSFSGYMLAAAVFSVLIYCMAEGQAYPAAYICLFAIAYHAQDVVRALEPEYGS